MEVRRLNKKGEAFSIAMIILFVIVLGIWLYEGEVQNRDYLGDASTMQVYNLKSQNPSCRLNEIKIEKEDVRLFSTLEEAKSKGFYLNETCD